MININDHVYELGLNYNCLKLYSVKKYTNRENYLDFSMYK